MLNVSRAGINLHGTTLEVADNFVFLGSKLTSNGHASGEENSFRSCLRRDICLEVKWKGFDACVWSVLFYGCDEKAAEVEVCRLLSSFVAFGACFGPRRLRKFRTPNCGDAAMETAD